ncbi:HEAT repeat domain-containing protein [Haliangium sp.]|uniref:HEAT repeat domain-containing protein n=1 Tax=Haliangium sp. TaxID=2663208 RepID=UPI003D09DF1D
MNACPACKAPIDPARAPVARVRDGRVVTFCSTACAEAKPAPTAANRTGATTATATTTAPARTQLRAATAPPVAEHEDRYDLRRSTPPGRRRGRVIALSAAMMAGGMVITVMSAVSPSTPTDVSAASQPRAPRAAAPVPAPASPTQPAETRSAPADPNELNLRAREILGELMSSPSARVQRIAAMAAARLGAEHSADAMAHLRQALDEEASDLGRIEIAYALARGGDAAGREDLVEALKHDRRDVRLDAARSLVRLGDDSGDRVLKRMLRLRTHRLGAAGLLARRGVEDGTEVLHEVLEDDDASHELVMRATVALGRAGDSSVRDRLVEILEDGRYHVGAADALAALGDRSAVPALIRQLDLPALRVRAALGLRRLGEQPDLAKLAAAMEEGGEAARVSAAEAMLILTGPRSLAELD